MKKLGLIVLIAGIVLMAGCAGDDPAGPGGTLPNVTGVTIDGSSAGTTINLSWDAVDDVDGYKVWFRTSDTGTWAEVGDVTTTNATHNATQAGYYVVTAYEGSDSSEGNSNEVNTMPTVVSTTYTIYDNYSPATEPSGFIFGASSGQTGMAGDPSFVQDVYAYDEDGPVDGDSNIRLYSGDLAPFGNGNTTYMAEPPSSGYYCELYGTGTWYPNYGIYSGDVRVYLHLENGNYVKMYNMVVTPDSQSDHGTMLSFSYEIQTGGLTVFTDN